jgi:hypothetical protein
MIGVAELRDSILISFLVCMNYYPYYLLLLLSYYYLLLWAAFSFVWLLFGGAVDVWGLDSTSSCPL